MESGDIKRLEGLITDVQVNLERLSTGLVRSLEREVRHLDTAWKNGWTTKESYGNEY